MSVSKPPVREMFSSFLRYKYAKLLLFRLLFDQSYVSVHGYGQLAKFAIL